MSSLPRNLSLPMTQSTWATKLDPVINFPPIKGNLLTNINLINGVTNINHKLSRTQQGWIITDIDGIATIYRSKPLNATTLTLTSDAAVAVSLWVY